ncbi:MAG: hypothetical protein ACR2O0_13840 [Rhizobiaceae bacterium]
MACVMDREVYRFRPACSAIIFVGAILLTACQTTSPSSTNSLGAEINSVRETYRSCTEGASKDPAVQAIRTKTPLQSNVFPSQKMKTNRDLMTDREIAAMDRYQELSSECREILATASGQLDPGYAAALAAGFDEQDKLVQALKKRQFNWGSYNAKYENLIVEVNEEISKIEKGLTG